MIAGFVNAYMEPVVPVAIVDSNGYRWRWEVVVDTGFNGDLTLPAELIEQLGLTLVGNADTTLADGQTIKSDYYRATTIWDGEYRNVYVVESATESLLGTNLIQGGTLTVQMWEGGDVVIDYATPPSRPPP